MTSNQHGPYVRGYTRATMAYTEGCERKVEQMHQTKAGPSSDWSLQLDPMKSDSLVIAHQPWRGEYVPGLVHTARQAMKAGVPEVRNRKDRPRAKLVIGAKSYSR